MTVTLALAAAMEVTPEMLISADSIKLSAREAPMFNALLRERGSFIEGRRLAKSGRVVFDQLSATIKIIRAKIDHYAPGWSIEGKRGFGYRLLGPGDSVGEPFAGRPPLAILDVAATARPSEPPLIVANPRLPALDALHRLAPDLVEDVRLAAFDAGETITGFVAKLLFYGLTVDRDQRAGGGQ